MLKKIPRLLMVVAATTVIIGSNALLVGCAEAQQQESTGQYIDSSAVTAKVKAKLMADKEMKSLSISVTTYKGTVQLSGFVESDEQKHRAEMIARSVPEVSTVENSLVIKTH